MIRILCLTVLAVVLPVSAGLTQQPAQAPSANHIAVGREVAIASGITRSLDAIIPQFFEQIRKQAVTRPELTKDLGEVFESLKGEMELQKQQMISSIGRVLATRMSEAELREVIAFFKSPAGQKYVETQPKVLDEIVREMQTWAENVSEYVMVRVRAEMNKRGHQMQ
jgi:uncharacterized protein